MLNTAAETPALMSQEQAQCLFFNSYKCRQLYTLIDSKRFHPSLSWLALKLDLQEPDVVVFLEVLLKLGLIRKTFEGFTSQPAAFEDGTITQISPREHAALTHDLLADLDSQGSESLFFCVATDEATRQNFMNEFKQLVTRLCESSKRSARNLIYTVSLSATKIVEPKGDNL